MRSVLSGGSPRNMLRSILSVTAGRAGIPDVVRAVLASADVAERHVVPHNLELVAVGILDDVQRDVRIGRLARPRLARCCPAWYAPWPAVVPRPTTSSTPSCRAGTSGRARRRSRRMAGPRRRSGSRCTASGPSGFSVPSTNPSRSRLSKNRNPCTSSTMVIASAITSASRVASSKQKSRVSARMWSNRSPG